jgi:glycosyltransferase involved in cell wall biosynthesis
MSSVTAPLSERQTLASSSPPSPLVSVLINNYNYGRFLRDAIDSALNQTYRNLEVVVVDDGSTDNSREIIASFGDRVIPVLKENGGQASAFNAGVAVSNGTWICLLDSDDVWLPNKVEQVVEAARRYPETALIYHRVQPVSADMHNAGKAWPSGVFRGWIAGRLRRCGGARAAPPSSALAVRADVFRAALPVPERECRICADAYVYQVIPFLGPVLGLKKALSSYRLHGSNQFSNKLRRELEGEAIMRNYLTTYETAVSAANLGLARCGVDSRISLHDHLGYQISRYKLRLPGRLSLRKLGWRALLLPGEPSVVVRCKVLAKLILTAVGLRP